MSVSVFYKGKCDNCGKNRPKLFIQLWSDRGDGVCGEVFWCLDCVRKQELLTD